MSTKIQKKGFTLIELSIVLVIIGLIVGGVLVGKDMIENATLRRQITQFEQLKTSLNTFRLKYNALPGDLTSTQATAFAMASRAGTEGRGDGNGIIGDLLSSLNLRYESSLIWNDLTAASLMEGSYPLNIDAAIEVASGDAALYLPPGKINGTYISVFQNGVIGSIAPACYARSCFALFNLDSTDNNGRYENGGRDALTPLRAYYIDSKMDDGLPLTGQVNAGSFQMMTGISIQETATAPCTTGVAPDVTYDMTPPNDIAVDCILDVAYK